MKKLIFSLLFIFSIVSSFGQGSGNSAQFNGTNKIDLGTSYQTLSNPITFTCWLKRGNTQYARIFLSNYYAQGYSGIWVQVTNPGALAFSYGDGTGFASSDRRSVISSGNHAFLNVWVHCAIVMTSLTSGQVYVNGVLVSSFTDGTGGAWFQSTTGDGFIGVTSGNQGVEHLTGEVDEMTIWNKALSATEIRNLVCRKTNANASLLLGNYDFDAPMGNQIFDSTPNGNHGTVVGSSLFPTSGAFIGDTSYYTYSNSGVGSFTQTLTSGTQIEVANISQNTPGVQVYEVLSTPNSVLGLPANANAQGYFGVFLTRTASGTKTFRLKINNYNSSMQVFQRNGNDDLIWTSISPVSVNGSVAEFPMHANHKEYYIIDNLDCQVDLGADISTCFPPAIWIKDVYFHPSKTYTWNGTTVADSLQITAPGTYFVEMDSLGCTATDTIVVSGNTLNTDLGPDISTCFPATLWIKDIYFHPSKTYTWNGTTVADSLQITAPGTYFVEVDSAGCTATDTIFISGDGVKVDLGSDQIICPGQSVWIKDFYFSSLKTYTWNGTTVADSLQVSSSQTVIVEVDSAGCSSFDTVVVNTDNYPPPVFDTDLEKCIETPEVFTFPEGNYSFLWPTGSTLNYYKINTQTQVVFYTISPCGDSTEHVLNITQNICDAPCYIFVPNSFTPNGDYKNDMFNVGVNCDVTYFSFQIFNRWGNILYHTENPYFQWDGTFEGKHLSDGVYIYIMHYSGFDREKKTQNGMIHILR